MPGNENLHIVLGPFTGLLAGEALAVALDYEALPGP